MTEAVASLVAYCRKNNRVCPVPPLWNQLWNILPNRRQTPSGWEPPLPLILAAWDDTTAISKMLRLEEHLDWAAKHGALEVVTQFLQGLDEADWFHVDD
jgi:hypothetical protein